MGGLRARQLHDTKDLPGGRFRDAVHLRADVDRGSQGGQASDAGGQHCRRRPTAAAVSPTSDANDEEVGGVRGRAWRWRRCGMPLAASTAAWRPANAEESFEIVRRRLFQPITGAALFVARDNTAKAFCDLYRSNIRSSRRNAARRITSGSSRRPIRFTRRFSTGSIRTGRAW